MDEFYEITNETHDRKTDSYCFANLYEFWRKAFSDTLLKQEAVNGPFCEGFVQRVRNWTTHEQEVSEGLERKKNLVAISDELLRNLEKFSNFVRHDDSVAESVFQFLTLPCVWISWKGR